MNSKYTVGIVTFDYDPPIGGQGVYVSGLANYLDRFSKRHRVLSSSGGGNENSRLPRFGSRNQGPILFSLMANFLMPIWSRKQKINLLHVQTGPGGVFVFIRSRLPLIVTAHMLYSEKLRLKPSILYKILSLLEKRTFKLADMIIATSEQMAGQIMDSYNIPHSRITVIPIGTDTDFFRPLKSSDIRKSAHIIFVGRLDENKQIVELTRIVTGLKKKWPELSMTIVGDGPLKNKLKDLIRGSNSQAYIKLVGFRQKIDLRNLYNSATLTVLSSKYEAYGMVVCESLACGIPVIVPDSSGLSRVVQQENCWDSFDGSAKDLRIKIEEFLSKKSIDSKRVRQVALNNFVEEKSYQQLLELYEEYL